VRWVLYTGKGGVGKTTTAAAAAALAARRGQRVLVASVDAAHSLGDVLAGAGATAAAGASGRALGPEPRELAPNLWAAELDARVESARHWGRIQHYVARLFAHQGMDAALAEELAMLPGAEELTALIAARRLSASGDWDLLVLDCAPTDAALRLVTLPEVARSMLRTVLRLLTALAGAAPLAQRLVAAPLPGAEVFAELESLLFLELAELHARITSPDTSVRLVVTPERMVIDEARRAYTELALFEVGCDAVVMNRLLPEAAASEPFFREWAAVQEERCAEVAQHFDPLPLLPAPLQPDEVVGLEALVRHGEALFGGLDPAARLCDPPRIRFDRASSARGAGAAWWARIPLPGAEAAGLDVAKVGDDLVISTAARRRALKLPRRFAPLSLHGARLDAGTLHVEFRRAEAL